MPSSKNISKNGNESTLSDAVPADKQNADALLILEKLANNCKDANELK
jgi:hypothetical protein